MMQAIEENKTPQNGDQVLQEVWRAKDALSSAYGHNLDRLFAEARGREGQSGHLLVEAPSRPSGKSLLKLPR